MRSVVCILLGSLALNFVLSLRAPSHANSDYASYANHLLKSLPKNVRYRPDLETYLNKQASAARTKAGEGPLKASKLMSKAARAQAAEMLLGNFVGHQSRGGYSFKQRLSAYTATDSSYWGENAARDRLPGKADKTKAHRLFTMWLRSKGHRKILMRQSFAYVSTGVLQKDNDLYAIQIFWEK